MLVEIAICTWNRASLLESTLESLEQIIVPADIQWRILLVDNNSNDSTRSVIEKFLTRMPIVNLLEKTQGHTFARNKAVRSAEGELLIWTDDDCLFNEHWLSKYIEAAEDVRFDFWGSEIEPRFQAEMPKWIADNWEICKGCFAARNLGDDRIAFTPDSLPYGANFAVRTKIQKAFLFDESLGRKALSVVGEDEREFMRRLISEGHQGCWVPDNSVQHLIPAERATAKYVYEYFVGQGSQIGLDSTTIEGGLFQKRFVAFWNWLMFKIKKPFVPSDVWLSHMLRSALLYGEATSNRKNNC